MMLNSKPTKIQSMMRGFIFLLAVNLIPTICHFQGSNAFVSLLETFEKHVLAVAKCA